ncbi:energy transducer TonB [Flavobacterium sp.]|uniref:energy transducer TonB n=1 Tax=Flavobacterium sp. TaxID=239 RepID=UPI00286E2AAF|nr:energy transducer TonB [Flavobacterium sp.]
MKLDIFKSKWIDMVFENRNKSYGAYELRKENPKTTIKALLVGGTVFAALMALPLLDLSGLSKADEEKVTLVDMANIAEPPPPPPPAVPPPPPPPPAPKIDEVKFVKPKVVEKEKVVEEIKTIEELKDKNVGAKDIKGRDDGKLVVDIPSGDGDNNAKIVDDTNIYNSAGIEVKPEYPGGIAKFYKYVSDKFKYPDDVEELKGKIFVEFVVEKDGSLTDIKVLRDVGHGTGAEAIRLLKTVPKWKPGVMNGKNVRVRYSLPITIDIKSE